MAMVTHISDKRCVVVEARNIGFKKAVSDLIDGELNGTEHLCSEMIEDAKKSLPVGYEVVDVDVKVTKDGKDFIVVLKGEKIV